MQYPPARPTPTSSSSSTVPTSQITPAYTHFRARTIPFASHQPPSSTDHPRRSRKLCSSYCPCACTRQMYVCVGLKDIAQSACVALPAAAAHHRAPIPCVSTPPPHTLPPIPCPALSHTPILTKSPTHRHAQKPVRCIASVSVTAAHVQHGLGACVSNSRYCLHLIDMHLSFTTPSLNAAPPFRASPLSDIRPSFRCPHTAPPIQAPQDAHFHRIRFCPCRAHTGIDRTHAWNY